jgi:tetratricopeptide (TPR) repeat protein
MRRAASALAGFAFCCALGGAARAQAPQPQFKTADTNNAVIQGRVTLPSGFAAKRYVRIVLKTAAAQSVLSTLYTNGSGEFQIMNLSEGVYYVQAETPDGSFEPAVVQVALGRGLVARLTLELREKRSPAAAATGARVVSSAELRQDVPAAAKRQYELGLKLVGKGDIRQAAARFEEAVALYPEYLFARNDLGAQYLKLKRLAEAEENFRFVLARDPKNFNAKFNLGLVRVERRDYAEAIPRLNEAIALDGIRPFPHLWLGFALLETGDPAGAEHELTKALLLGGVECAAANYHLARIYLGRGDSAEALRALRAYLEDAPKGEYADEARQLLKKIQSESKQRPGR